MKNMRNVLNEILDGDLTPGEALREARILCNISQDELAEVTGVARTNISAIERGRVEMSFHYALIFGAALKVHPAQILFPNGKFRKTDEILKIEKKAAVLLKKKSAG